jgi:UDP-N-acetylmuramate dehydrogenase
MSPRYEQALRPLVGDRLRLNEPLHRYTVARLGGPADALVNADSAALLEAVARLAWLEHWPVRILGGGANVLISDQGYRGAIMLNRSGGITFEADSRVAAESGVNLITLARQCMERGLSGLEWAIGIPGSFGGAIVNNAGAHGGDMASCLEWVEIALPDTPAERWPASQLAYAYRESALKRRAAPFVVLAGQLRLTPGHDPAALKTRAEEFTAHRKRTQPPGASLGSMFKNPPGDYAGRLIEAAGLKGKQIGGVIISPVHANFFVNTGGGTASDYYQLIRLAQDTVRDRFGVALELEIELIGEGFEPG